MNPMPERHQKVYFKTMALMHSVTYDKLKVSQWLEEGKLMLKCKFDQRNMEKLQPSIGSSWAMGVA